MACYVGIDPGKTGAMAIIDGLLDSVTIYDFDDGRALLALKSLPKNSHAVLEKVAARPKQGVVGMFAFGTNFGTWIGRLEALGVPFDFVTPQKWQKAMFDSAPKKNVTHKTQSLNRARRLFPHAHQLLTRQKDHHRADALLMAEYCRRYVFLKRTECA